MIILATMVSLFAAFALGLAWAQHHARLLTAAPVDAPRPRRRPF
jgi:cell division protein FtsL